MSGGEKKKQKGKHTKEEIDSLGVAEKDLWCVYLVLLKLFYNILNS